jgi:hypothetical protein
MQCREEAMLIEATAMDSLWTGGHDFYYTSFTLERD